MEFDRFFLRCIVLQLLPSDIIDSLLFFDVTNNLEQQIKKVWASSGFTSQNNR